jgi:hypothetical protein
VTSDGVPLPIGPDLPRPEASFYADRLLVVEHPGAVSIIAAQVHLFAGADPVAVELVFPRPLFVLFAHSLTSLRRPDGEPDLPAGGLNPAKLNIQTKLSVGYAYSVVSSMGATIDFYMLSARDLFDAQNGRGELIPRPVLRIDLVPGRVWELVESDVVQGLIRGGT